MCLSLSKKNSSWIVHAIHTWLCIPLEGKKGGWVVHASCLKHSMNPRGERQLPAAVSWSVSRAKRPTGQNGLEVKQKQRGYEGHESHLYSEKCPGWMEQHQTVSNPLFTTSKKKSRQQNVGANNDQKQRSGYLSPSDTKWEGHTGGSVHGTNEADAKGHLWTPALDLSSVPLAGPSVLCKYSTPLKTFSSPFPVLYHAAIDAPQWSSANSGLTDCAARQNQSRAFWTTARYSSEPRKSSSRTWFSQPTNPSESPEQPMSLPQVQEASLLGRGHQFSSQQWG